jgi:ribosomal protein L10
MSKLIKQMEMAALKDTLQGVRDMVVLKITGLDGTATTTLRAQLRKKKVRLHGIKNSLTCKVFADLGIKVPENSEYWLGPTILAFGSDSAAGLCKAITGELKDAKRGPLYKDKVIIKGGVAEGAEVPFDVMEKMPTREEALAKVIGLALSPARRLAAQIIGPASSVASQIKSHGERKEEAPAPPQPA